MLAHCEGASIAYDDVGTGPPVVFLHGFPHDRTLWTPQVIALSLRARCVSVDLRGFGESSTAGPFDMDRYADDVACVLDATEIDRAVVVGLSMGGYVAFALWRRHRARVRALALVSTRATADDAAASERRRALIETARREGSAAVARTQLPGALSRRALADRPELVQQVLAMHGRAPVAGIVGALEAMIARPDSSADLAGITVPTLVIAGRSDALIRPEAARALHEGIPGSTLEMIDRAGHLCTLERPSAVNHLLAEFVARVAS